MARKPRIHIPGAVYHVIQRGNARQTVFRDDDDFGYYCTLMQEGVERFRCRILAFCLMPDHVHLAVQVGDLPLSRLMQNIGYRYTRWFNERHGRSGQLFQGRYKAVMVDSDAYLQELIRYIHLNPVRAGLAQIPVGYKWSSHRAYCGQVTVPWLTTDWALAEYDDHARIAINRFQRFVADGLSEGTRDDLQGRGGVDSRLLGDEAFLARALAAPPAHPKCEGDARAAVEAVLRAYELTDRQLSAPGKTRPAAEARAVAALIVYEDGHGTLTELGGLVGRDVTTLSSAVQRLKKRLADDPGLAAKVAALREPLTKPQT